MPAHASPSYLGWLLSSIGPVFLLIFAVTFLVSGIICVIIIFRERGAIPAAALVLAAHFPLIVGIISAVISGISAFQLIAMSAVSPKPSELAAGISGALFSLLAGAILTLMLYVICILGGVMTSLKLKTRQMDVE
ncbi:MAG: hypothetical protein KDA78_14845 [Planctomycetaceae bacterium]|nr:hypothetical protein [Planctomycetaceae bacterium]